jgi:hypothetical protein
MNGQQKPNPKIGTQFKPHYNDCLVNCAGFTTVLASTRKWGIAIGAYRKGMTGRQVGVKLFAYE